MKNKLIVSLSICLALVVIILSVLILPFGVKVKAVPGNLSLSIGMNQAQAAELSDWTIQFEPSGTQVTKDNYLIIRLDFYPPEGSKTYDIHYVYVVDTTSAEYLTGYPGKVDANGEPVDQKEFDSWLDSLPHIWRLNPALCVLLPVRETITVLELEAFIKETYNADVTATLDDILVLPDSIHYVSPFMRDKVTYEKTAVLTANTEAVITDTNTKLSAVSVTGTADGTVIDVEKQSIDVGPGATNRNATQTSVGYTCIEKQNPANADGTLDTVEFFYNTDAAGVKIGTFYLSSGTTYVSRDYETIGNVASGSKITISTGISIDVVTNDLLGEYRTSGYLERDNTGTSGYYYASGDKMGASASYTSTDNARSLYATGSEAGSDPSLTNTPSSKDMGVLWMERTYYAKGNAPGNPVESGNCTFTITNDGSITENITISITNLTGGTTWTPVSGSPGASEYRITFYYAGQNPASGVVGSTSAQTFYNGLAASANITWDFKFETGTWTNGDTTQRTGTIQLTAVAP